MSDTKYGAVLVDPPWRFNRWGKYTGNRGAECHYPTMTLSDIKALPVQALMAKHCAVFMWTSAPYLPQALELGGAWGLSYKTVAFTWVKSRAKVDGAFARLSDPSIWHLGMGYWTRSNPEFCLLFVRGSPKPRSRSVRELIVSPVRRHSQKPDEQYGRIEALVDGPYVELFARQAWPNWSRWGNEVESTVAFTA